MHLNEISSLPSEEAVEALDKFLSENPENDEAYTLRGLRHWSLGHRSKAIGDYLKAIAINPHSPAVQALENAKAILDYYNKDLYNP